MSNEKFDKKFNKFIRFLENRDLIQGLLDEPHTIDNQIGCVRVVPDDYDIIDIPIFKRYCKMVGLEIISDEFNDDIQRLNEYRQWHEVELIDNGNFFKEYKTLEDLYE